MTITHAPAERPEEPQRPQLSPEQVELRTVDTHRGRFRWLSYLMIGVSFVHMASALLLFSGEGLIDQASTVGMILGVELLTTFLALLIDYSKRAGMDPGCLAWGAFIFTLMVSWGLNTSYLWSHRPPPDKIPERLGQAIAVGFGAFIPLCILVAATIQGKLEDFRLKIEQRHAERAAQQRRREAAQTRVRDVTPPREPAAQPLREPAPAPTPLFDEPRADDVLTAPRANNEPQYTLDGLLTAAGLGRTDALATLARYGLSNADDAYAGLKRFGRLPDGLGRERFAELFDELRASDAAFAASRPANRAANREPRTGNGKAELATSDVRGILARLAELGITRFVNQNDLCEPCGWASNSSAGKAVRALLAAGAIRQTDVGFEVVAVVAESEVEA